MRGTLRLGIQKTLGVVQSHYLINLAALATGYIMVDDLDDDKAQAVVDRQVLSLLLSSPLSLTTSRKSSSRTLPPPDLLSPESSLALWPLGRS
jgi:hypothetical protein